jgi:hypothetical protein
VYGLWEELLICADLYANKCTKQEEKFGYYADKVPWTWADCEAAYVMFKDIPNSWVLMDNYRKWRSFPADDWTPENKPIAHPWE